MTFTASPAESGAEGRRQRSSGAMYLAGAMGLALAATAGSLLLRLATAHVPFRADVREHAVFYAYEFVGASVVFGIFGWIVGARLDRARRRRDWYRDKAEHDDLTGFLTPSAFRRAVALALTSGDIRAPIAVLLATVEGLQGSEREHGSGLTKAVLLHVAAAVRHVAPPDAVVSRWGGLEIAILLPDPSYDLDSLPQRLSERIAERPVLGSGTRFFCKAKVGGYIGPGNLAPERILLRAEEALAEAHRNGKTFQIAVT